MVASFVVAQEDGTAPRDPEIYWDKSHWALCHKNILVPNIILAGHKNLTLLSILGKDSFEDFSFNLEFIKEENDFVPNKEGEF